MATIWERYTARVQNNCIGDINKTDGLGYWRNKLFSTIILFLFPLALIILTSASIVVFFLGVYELTLAYISFGLAIAIISLYKGMPLTTRKYLFLLLLYAVAIILIFYTGHFGAGLTYLFGITVFSLLILPKKAGIYTVFINIGICALQAAAIHFGLSEYPLRSTYQVASWIAISANSILLSTVAVILMPMLFKGLQETINSQKELKQKLVEHKSELESSLSEKNTLLAEIHHRVKNNLAVVSGMLQIQSFKETNETFQKKLMDSTMRIKSMANIHEQLYQSKSFSSMSFDRGVKNLVHTILATMSDGRTVKAQFDLQPIKLNINQAIPCSLIVNEVVTNCLKHAYNDTDNGILSIKLWNSGNNLCLTITDNGPGISNDVDSKKSSSLGLELIRTLAKQLDADYEYKSREDRSGALFFLSFKIR